MNGLANRTFSRLNQAYNKKTWAAYKGMFITFMCFCNLVNVDISECEVHHVLMFMQYLSENGLKTSSVRNYLGYCHLFEMVGVRSQYIFTFQGVPHV